MSLAPDRPRRPPQRRSESLFFREPGIENRFFEGFLEKEVTEKRKRAMIRELRDFRKDQHSWGSFCEQANALSLFIPDQLSTRLFDRKVFEGIMGCVTHVKTGDHRNIVHYARTLETFYPHKRSDYDSVLTEDLEGVYYRPGLTDTINNCRESEMWDYLYNHLAEAFVSNPSMGVPVALTKEDALQAIAFLKTKDMEGFVRMASYFCIVQPEYRQLLPIDSRTEQEAHDYLLRLDREGEFKKMARFFERVAICSSADVKVPSRGRIVLSKRQPVTLSNQRPLPSHPEYT